MSRFAFSNRDAVQIMKNGNALEEDDEDVTVD